MFAFKGGTLSVVVVAFAALVLWSVQAPQDASQQGSQFQAGEGVESIRLEIVVGASGEALDEPIALDLGLGFPLWLQQVGRDDDAAVSFGAVSQQGTAARAIRAGERAVFQFAATGAAEMDRLLTTPQLLSGVHVSDISRVAFTSRADRGWIIASYTLSINGKPFCSNASANANGRGLQDAARDRLMEIQRDSGAQQTELSELQALVATGLATDADRTRLAELTSTVAPITAEQRRLERQLVGAAPFYTDSNFRPIGRSGQSLESVKVTVVTAPHQAAETRNYVYFRVGGNKFLLGSPEMPLSPAAGPQEFELDLASTPLVASDLRGFALGMLAHTERYAAAPDRWHPQRLRVEVDGRTVYDSEDSALDRASLSAIRIIPPAHYDGSGNVVTNTPIERETFVWEAGSGAGLDLVNGGTAALPAEVDEDFPQPEPVVNVDENNVAITIDASDNWYDPLAEPFPGECGFGPDWQPGWAPPPWYSDWAPWQPDWQPGWGPGWLPGPSWLDALAWGLMEELGLLPDWVIPDPVGDPPQVESVDINFSNYRLEWDVTGDVSQIDHYLVEVVRIRPDLDVPFVAAMSEPLEVAAGQTSIALGDLTPILAMMTGDEMMRSYMGFRVVIVPTDPAIGVDPAYSPILPIDTDHPLTVVPTFQYQALGPPETRPLSMIGEPEVMGAAAWQAGRTDTHNGLVFSGANSEQYHLGARAQDDAEHLTLRLTGTVPEGQHRLIAYLGFRGAVEQATTVDVEANCLVSDLADPLVADSFSGTVNLTADPALPPTPMQPLVIDFDTTTVAPGTMNLNITLRFSYSNVDPRHPPVLMGIRLLHLP